MTSKPFIANAFARLLGESQALPRPDEAQSELFFEQELRQRLGLACKVKIFRFDDSARAARVAYGENAPQDYVTIRVENYHGRWERDTRRSLGYTGLDMGEYFGRQTA